MTLGRATIFIPVLALILAACTPPTAEKPAFIQLANNQAASVVIGQVDPTSSGESDTSRLIGSPYGRPLILNDVLYLPDYGEDRIMGYIGVPTNNDAAADFVLGAENFDDSVSTPVSAQRMNGPQSIATDGTRVFTLEYSTSRILVFNTAPTTNFATADRVIGQPDFTAETGACLDNRFDSPEGMFVHGGKLFVADSRNNRVLIWNTVPTDASVGADLVLGQDGFTTCAANDDAQVGVDATEATARTMDYPSEVWTNGKILMVADADNNRVLIWNTIPTVNFTPADLVLGQADLTGNLNSSGPSGLDSPQSLHSNGTQLFVADSDNNRVLVWNTMPTTTGQAADVVLGQISMDAFAANGGSPTATASGLDFPTGVFALGNLLVVADNNNDRYVIYEGVTAP